MIRNVISGWVTRATAAKRLGVSSVRLRALEKAGALTPAADFAGRARYDPSEIEKIRAELTRPAAQRRDRARPPSGATCARIFRMFDERAELRRIVVECEQPPEVVLNLRRQHAELGRDFLLTPATVAEVRELLDWHGDSERSLLVAISGRLRHQFERGKELGIQLSPRNHKGKAPVNVEAHGRREAQSRRDLAGGEGPLRGDSDGQTPGLTGDSDP